ncbi:MAG TPA: hypothetical protein VLB46_11075 [Pyrinomonadaceae bacterium]|nr:hypothetical protein [Pyrinomonadaceae bacterium]
MLEELVRKQRDRDGQIDEVIRTLRSVQASAERSSLTASAVGVREK